MPHNSVNPCKLMYMMQLMYLIHLGEHHIRFEKCSRLNKCSVLLFISCYGDLEQNE